MRRTALAAALIPCALLLTACSSSSGTSTSTVAGASNANLTQAQLLARFTTALATATALHIKGGTTGGSSPFSMDMQINKDGSAQGTIVSTGMTMPLIVVGGVTYVQVTSSLSSIIKDDAGSDAAAVSKLVVGKWISSKSSIGASLTQGMDGMTDFSQMTKQLASGSGDTFSYLDTATVNGEQVAQYKDVTTGSSLTGTGTASAGATTSTLDVPLTGAALPVEETGSSEGTVTFTWNVPQKVAAPDPSEVITLPAA